MYIDFAGYLYVGYDNLSSDGAQAFLHNVLHQSFYYLKMGIRRALENKTHNSHDE